MKPRFAAVVAVATLVGASLAAAGAAAQTPQAPPMQSILAGKKFTPPIKGQAEVDFLKGSTVRQGTTLVTKIQVRNMSKAPIPRLKISETWYAKDGSLIPGGEGVINGLLQPGEIQTIEIRTPANPNMNQSMYNFSHANGTVKTHPVKSFDVPKEPAAKTASATKSARKK